jgi:hypothetical protein
MVSARIVNGAGLDSERLILGVPRGQQPGPAHLVTIGVGPRKRRVAAPGQTASTVSTYVASEVFVV